MPKYYQIPELPIEKKIEVINYVTSKKKIRISDIPPHPFS